jgi:hypothetical protein
MPWTYLKLDEDGERLPDSPELPGARTVYLCFDICRMAVVLGYTERGGYHSMLSPNVNDDCDIVAFAPLSETSLLRLALLPLPASLFWPRKSARAAPKSSPLFSSSARISGWARCTPAAPAVTPLSSPPSAE